MKKIIIALLACVIVIISFIALFSKKNDKVDNTLKKIKVAEVTHSIFYAPQYLAISKGFFKEEGLEIELVLTPGVNGLFYIIKIIIYSYCFII